MAIEIEVLSINRAADAIIVEARDTEVEGRSIRVDVPVPVDDQGNATVSSRAELVDYIVERVRDAVEARRKHNRTKDAVLTWLEENAVGKTVDVTDRFGG